MRRLLNQFVTAQLQERETRAFEAREDTCVACRAGINSMLDIFLLLSSQDLRGNYCFVESAAKVLAPLAADFSGAGGGRRLPTKKKRERKFSG